MKKQIFISFHRVLAVLMLLIASFVSAYGQSVIRRTPTKKTKTHTTPVTQKRKTTVSRSHTTRQRPRIRPQTRRRSYNNYDDYVMCRCIGYGRIFLTSCMYDDEHGFCKSVTF